MAQKAQQATDALDVRAAAALTGRHPETIRRWVWSGRLTARRQGNRLMLSRADVEALARAEQRPQTSLAAWARRARTARERAGTAGSGSSAAALVIEDRARRSGETVAGR